MNSIVDIKTDLVDLKFVKAEELPLYTQYTILAMAEDRVKETYQEEVPNTIGTYNTTWVSKIKFVDRICFLIGREKETVIQALKEKLATAATEASLLANQRKEFETLALKLEVESSSLKSEKIFAQKRVKEKEEENNRLQTKLHHMEADLGKIRAYFGEKAVMEAIEK